MSRSSCSKAGNRLRCYGRRRVLCDSLKMFHCIFLSSDNFSVRSRTYVLYSFKRTYAYSLRARSDEGIWFFLASNLMMISSAVSSFACLPSAYRSASISSKPITPTSISSVKLSMRRPTGGGATAHSPPIHPFSSCCNRSSSSCDI